MIRKIISVFFYVLGGFFVYMVCLLAFSNIQADGVHKFVIIGVFSVPALFFLFLGAATYRFQKWKSSIGIALLSGVSINLLVIVMFISLQLSSEFNEMYPNNQMDTFNDYISGFAVMMVLAALGLFLLLNNQSKVDEAHIGLD